MNRRTLLLVPAVAPIALLEARSPAPADPSRINAFTIAYKRYVVALSTGERSLEYWSEVERLWARLE